MKVIEIIIALSGWAFAFAVNAVWFRTLEKQNAEWSDLCGKHNREWSEFCQQIIDSFTEEENENQA